ncbi:MAG TPA: O-antigen ligase family protein [Solirubrobacterales bacterium]|jgi:O-antigen ligase
MKAPTPKTARRRRLLAFTAISLIVALLAAIASVTKVSVFPPSLQSRDLQRGAATTRILVDLPAQERGHVSAPEFEAMSKRASLIANLLASPPVLHRIADQLGVSVDEVTAATEITEGVPLALVEPNEEKRANEILLSHDGYRLDIQANPTLPIIDIYAQAPTPGGAAELADAVAPAGNEYTNVLADRDNFPVDNRVQLKQLGAAQSAAISPSAPIEIFAITFIVIFGVAFGLLAGTAAIRRGWVRGGSPPRLVAAKAKAPPAEVAPGGNWPHTTRILPWMVAGFICLLWLTPFNDIQLNSSLPVDLKLDRLVLPIIVLAWLLAFALGGRGGPRWKFTPIHAALAVFAAAAGLSVVLNAGYLDQTLEFGLALKKLALLGAYLSFFLVIASVVRKGEIRPFMNLILGLAVIVAVGTLWEFNFHYNVFYGLTQKLLPGGFTFTASGIDGVDEIGRRLVVGPTEHGLEVVAMLSMALPIALVRLMETRRWRERFLYGLIICLIFGAALATYRKSAILAPIAACLVLAYFRRRELLRLAPLGLVLLVAIPILSPNALGSVIEQLHPNKLGVSTVSDRVSDYDAIRPDVLSNPAFGRGFGSYNHTSYRILDNELLTRLVESGIVGVLAFILIIVTIVGVAAPIIRSRDPSRAPPALAIAAAAVPFLVLSGLFDEMSFPHAPYVLLTLAGLLAVLASEPSPAESLDRSGLTETARSEFELTPEVTRA